MLGLDPRTCTVNQTSLTNGGTPTAPAAPDYTSCGQAATGSAGTHPGHLYIPNPATGTFDSFGQFRQPWQFNMGLQMTYDLSSQVTANLIVANLVNQCFGGSSEPWTQQFAPSSSVCGYGSNAFYISNFFNGKSPNDTSFNGVPLNPYFAQPFVPSAADVNSSNFAMPLQLYLQLQVKM